MAQKFKEKMGSKPRTHLLKSEPNANGLSGGMFAHECQRVTDGSLILWN